MKVFLKKILRFLLILSLGFTFLVIGTKAIVFSTFDFTIPSEKNILILGDSHTQCSMDDNIIANSLNMSESADTYFYSYIKLKNIITYNKQIDTLVLAYAPHNISKTQDKWLVDNSINSFKLPLHFFLFDTEDIMSFISNSPFQTVKYAPLTIKNNLGHLYRVLKKEKINRFGIGGFLALPNKHSEKTKIKKKSKIEFSTNDVFYLEKIYSYCEKYKIKLILINTPIEQSFEEDSSILLKKYLEFKNDKLSNAILLDCSKIVLKKTFFADKDHLNCQGARFFSEWFKKNINK